MLEICNARGCFQPAGRAHATPATRPAGSAGWIAHQVVDHRRIGQRRGVAEVGEIVLGDLAQDPAHDLAGAGLRQTGRELQQVRAAIAPISFRTQPTSSFFSSSLGVSPVISVT